MVVVQNTRGRAYHLLVFDTKGKILLEAKESGTGMTYSILLEGKPAGYYRVVLKIAGATEELNLIKR